MYTNLIYQWDELRVGQQAVLEANIRESSLSSSHLQQRDNRSSQYHCNLQVDPIEDPHVARNRGQTTCHREVQGEQQRRGKRLRLAQSKSNCSYYVVYHWKNIWKWILYVYNDYL